MARFDVEQYSGQARWRPDASRKIPGAGRALELVHSLIGDDLIIRCFIDYAFPAAVAVSMWLSIM
ncbi:hypothetical protein QNH14_19245 [Apirhabdus apintestini]|nr:hypothetical protein QNH14_19245 [Enterobacteriaceae bacterium CA-0114]